MKLSSSVFDRQFLKSAPAGKTYWLWQDILIFIILAIIAGLVSYGCAQFISPFCLKIHLGMFGLSRIYLVPLLT